MPSISSITNPFFWRVYYLPTYIVHKYWINVKSYIFLLGRSVSSRISLKLTADVWVSGLDLAPQTFLLSQQFRYLMRCKEYLEKFFLSCLVSEIQLFVYIFGWISKWPPEVRKGSLVKFFEVSYYQKNFQPPTVHNSEDRGGVKMPYDFFVYICDF